MSKVEKILELLSAREDEWSAFYRIRFSAQEYISIEALESSPEIVLGALYHLKSAFDREIDKSILEARKILDEEK